MLKKKLISYGSHFIDQNDINGVSKVLKSKFLTQGPLQKKFEKDLKNYFHVKNVVTCSSGTSAIHLAMLAMNIKKNDIVLMPVTNFISAYNISSFLGCKIYYVDIDEYSGLVNSKTIINCIKENNLKKIDLIFLMHHGGKVCNLEEINSLKKLYKFKIIEDACHAVGSTYEYNGKVFKSGCSLHSDASIFSFHAIKTITTGEGGALLTNKSSIAKKAELLRSHGIKRSDNHWKYDVVTKGLNYRLNEIGCSLGISQLKKINKFIKYRRKIALNYFRLLEKYKNIISLPEKKQLKYSSWHLFTISINFSKFKKKKYDLFKFMKKKNILLQQHYIPINLFKFSQKNKNLKGSKFFFNNSFTLPIHLKIEKIDQNRIVKELIHYIKLNTKKKI